MSRTFFSAAHGCDLFLFALSPDNDTYIDPNEIYLPLTLEQTAKKLTQAINGSLILASIYFLGQSATQDFFCEDILMMNGDTERKSCIKLRFGCAEPNFYSCGLSDLFSQGVIADTLREVNASVQFTKEVYVNFFVMTLFPRELYLFLGWIDRKNQLEQSLLNSPEFIEFFKRCSFDELCVFFDEAAWRIFKRHEKISIYYPAIFQQYFLFLKKFLTNELTEVSVLLPATELTDPVKVTRLICIKKILRAELDYFIEEIASPEFNENLLMRFSDIAIATVNLLVPVLNHDHSTEALFIRFLQLSAFMKSQVEFLRKYSPYVMIDADFHVPPKEKNEANFRIIVNTLRFWMTEWPLFRMPEDRKRDKERVLKFLHQAHDRCLQMRQSQEVPAALQLYITVIQNIFLHNEKPNAIALLCVHLSGSKDECVREIENYFFKQLVSYFVFEFISEIMPTLLKSKKIDFIDRINLLMLLIEREVFASEVLAELIQSLVPLYPEAREVIYAYKDPAESKTPEVVSRSSTPAASSASSSNNYFSFLYNGATMVKDMVIAPISHLSQSAT